MTWKSYHFSGWNFQNAKFKRGFSIVTKILFLSLTVCDFLCLLYFSLWFNGIVLNYVSWILVFVIGWFDHNVTLLDRKSVATLFLSKRSEKGKKRKMGNSAIKQENDNHTPCIFVAFLRFQKLFHRNNLLNLKKK